MGIILAILLAISAGVSFNAEQSLPGDALYPIKTELNERVQGWLALSAEAESEHQANLAIRRLEEAEKLKSEGRLNEGLKLELERDFKEHVKIAEEKSDNDSSARIRIKSSVSAKGSVLGITEIEIENEFENEDEMEAKISGDFGEAKLEFDDGALKLSGKLNRANPCIDWDVETTISKDSPPSDVTFNIAKKSTSEICIQVLGEPEKIEAKTPAIPDANITVKIEGGVVFSGKLK